MTTRQQVRRLGTCALATTAAIGLFVPPAMAARPEESKRASAPREDFDLELAAGVACDFALGVVGTGGVLVTPPREGGTVIQAGRGSQLTFTNLGDPSQTLSLRSNGAVSRTTTVDGLATVEQMGHNVLVLFPTDVPAGPSTTLYVGRVVYTIDEQGVFTVLKSSGQTVDICDALES